MHRRRLGVERGIRRNGIRPVRILNDGLSVHADVRMPRYELQVIVIKGTEIRFFNVGARENIRVALEYLVILFRQNKVDVISLVRAVLPQMNHIFECQWEDGILIRRLICRTVSDLFLKDLMREAVHVHIQYMPVAQRHRRGRQGYCICNAQRGRKLHNKMEL